MAEKDSGSVTINVPTGRLTLTGHAPTTSVSSTYAIAAATATTLAESQACIAAESKLRGLSFPLVRVLADEEDSAVLRHENDLDAIEARVVRILAAGEIERRQQAEAAEIERQKQADATRKWIYDKWVMLFIAAFGWIAAIIIALYK